MTMQWHGSGQDGHSATDSPDGLVITDVGRVTGVDKATAPHLVTITALTFAGTPQINDLYDPADTVTRLRNRSARVVTGSSTEDYTVEVDLEYGKIVVADPFAGDPPINNTGQFVRTLTYRTVRATFYEDPFGFGQDFVLQPPPALRDVAGQDKAEPQNAAVEIEWSLPVFRFERNEVDDDQAKAAVGAVNSDTVDGWAPRTLKCEVADSIQVDGGNWRKRIYEFVANVQTWDTDIRWLHPDGTDPGSHDAQSQRKIRSHYEQPFGPLNLDFS